MAEHQDDLKVEENEAEDVSGGRITGIGEGELRNKHRKPVPYGPGAEVLISEDGGAWKSSPRLSWLRSDAPTTAGASVIKREEGQRRGGRARARRLMARAPTGALASEASSLVEVEEEKLIPR